RLPVAGDIRGRLPPWQPSALAGAAPGFPPPLLLHHASAKIPERRDRALAGAVPAGLALAAVDGGGSGRAPAKYRYRRGWAAMPASAGGYGLATCSDAFK